MKPLSNSTCLFPNEDIPWHCNKRNLEKKSWWTGLTTFGFFYDLSFLPFTIYSNFWKKSTTKIPKQWSHFTVFTEWSFMDFSPLFLCRRQFQNNKAKSTTSENSQQSCDTPGSEPTGFSPKNLEGFPSPVKAPPIGMVSITQCPTTLDFNVDWDEKLLGKKFVCDHTCPFQKGAPLNQAVLLKHLHPPKPHLPIPTPQTQHQ